MGFGSGVDFARSEQREELLEAGRRYGQGLQLVNVLRDVVEDLPKGRCYLPHDELRAAGWSDGESWRTEGNRAALLTVAERWRAKARGKLEAGERYADRLQSWRIRLATRLPARLGLRTLECLDRAGAEAFERRVKISRAAVWRELASAALARRRCAPH